MVKLVKKLGDEVLVNAETLNTQSATNLAILPGGGFGIKAHIFSISDVTGPTEGPDTLNGTPDADTIDGLGGNDVINGLGGNDVLVGGAGSDTLNGGDDDDVLFAGLNSPAWSHPSFPTPGAPPPVLDTGTEHDVLSGGNGSDVLWAGYGDDVDGGAELDDELFISFLGAASGVTADFRQLFGGGSLTVGGGIITGIESIGWLEGSEFDDELTVNLSNSFGPVYGLGGNDHIVAGHGTGILYGGAGNDILDATLNIFSQFAYGEAGNDTIYGGDGGETLDGGDGDDILNGYRGADKLLGGIGQDTLDGGVNKDTLDGGDGNDTLYGAGDAEWRRRQRRHLWRLQPDFVGKRRVSAEQ